MQIRRAARGPWLPCRERLVEIASRTGRSSSRGPSRHTDPDLSSASARIRADARDRDCAGYPCRRQREGDHLQFVAVSSAEPPSQSAMKFIGPVSGVHLRKRWIASQYVVFSGGRCAPTIRVQPAGRAASPRASSGELGSSSRCWTSAPPVAGPRFSITKD
jgi:hypothetical protein